MSDRKNITCNLCGAAGLHWQEYRDDKFRLADASGQFHDCPNYVKKPRNPTGYPMMKRDDRPVRRSSHDRLMAEIKKWVQDYKHDMTDDMYADIQDILIEFTVMQK